MPSTAVARTARRCAIALAAALASTAAAQAPVVLNTGAAALDDQRFVITRAFELTQQLPEAAGQQPAATSAKHELTVEIDTTERSRLGEAFCTARIVRYALRVEDATGVEAIVAVADDAPPAAVAGPQGLARAFNEVSLRFVVDLNGGLRELRGVATLQERAGEIEGLPAAAAEFFNAEALAELFESLFNAEGAAGKRHNLGDTWITGGPIDLGAAGTATKGYSWTVARINTPRVTITGAMNFQLAGPENSDTLKAEVAQATGTSTIVWHVDEGLQSRTTSERIVTRWTAGDLTLEQTQTASFNVERAADG